MWILGLVTGRELLSLELLNLRKLARSLYIELGSRGIDI